MAKERGQKEVNVAARLGSTEVEKLERVMDLMESVTGERNTSAALRYIVANFDIATSPLGKQVKLVDLDAPAEDDDEEDAALARHASKIYEDVRSGKENPVPLAEIEAELVAAGVIDG